ncbi:MAG: glutamate racemase [Spirochaetales bacterium]|nr:glutamate racemase [Spirochaetales bacterium]
MSDNKPIVFFDSGVGGLPYLKLALDKLPKELFIYVADRKNYPYGDKTAAHIRQLVIDSIGCIINCFDPKLIVVACNTASVVALAALRKTYSIPFIGVVPAIKPAASLSENGKVGVLATEATLKNEYIAQLIRDYAQDCQVVLIPANDLRDLVEERFFSVSEDEKRAIVRRAVAHVRAADVDAVVLACTHFLHVENEFRQMLNSSVHLIDSRAGVINQLKRVLGMHNIQAVKKQGTDTFYLTAASTLEAHYKKYCRQFKLEYSGVLK